MHQKEGQFLSLYESVHPAMYNPRRWDEEAVKRLTDSISRFGLVDPIIVNSASKRENVVIGGHFRLKVAGVKRRQRH